MEISKIIGTVALLMIGYTLSYSQITAKYLEKNLAWVSDSIYAYRYETSNSEYKTFLETIKEKDPSLYEQCKVDSNGWLKIARMCEPLAIHYDRHPAFKDYPVVNVDYIAANAYCNWLSSLYNTDPRRKFKKVVFTLPTTEEWIIAAQAGRTNAIFPWTGFYFRDKKGQYMCNMKHINEINVISGENGQPVFKEPEIYTSQSYYTATVRSFFPNDFGIYNMSGNVAEMTFEKGKAKGGSWNSFGGEVTIMASKTYEGASPELGFRVFMKIIEK